MIMEKDLINQQLSVMKSQSNLLAVNDKPIIKKNIKKIIPKKSLKKFLKFYITKVMNKPKIKHEENEFLKNLFNEDVKTLEKILKRKTSWQI